MFQIKKISQIEKYPNLKKMSKIFKMAQTRKMSQISKCSKFKKLSQEFKIVQNTGNVSYISSAIYSTHARPERRRREGHCKTNANAWRSSPFQNIVIPLFFSFIFVQIFSNPSTVLYPHLWWSCFLKIREEKENFYQAFWKVFPFCKALPIILWQPKL